MSKITAQKIPQEQDELYLFYKPLVARGFGHIGIIIKKGDDCYEYQQGAVNPNDKAFQLLLWKQKAVVSKKKKRIKRHVAFTYDQYRIVRLRNYDVSIVEKQIIDYISADRPYNSIFNNCATFVWFVLNNQNRKIKKGIFPKHYFHYLKRRLK